MMKRILIFTILILLFIMPVSAEDDGFYKEQYEKSGAGELEDALPESAGGFFSENGIDTSDYNWVNSLTGESVFKHIWGFVRSGASAPLKAGAGLLGIILITAAVSFAAEGNAAMGAAVYVSVLSCAAVLAVPVYGTVSAAADALRGSGTFMLSFIPVFAVTVAASGGTVTSASMSTLLLGAAEGVTYISSFILLPLMGGYLAVSLSVSASPLLQRSGIADGIRKLALWIITLLSTVFAGILGIQTAVNSAADSVSLRTAKFILGSSVPVAGTALSEAVSTVTASMRLLRSSTGIYGVVALAAIFLPLVVELILWRTVLIVLSAAGELFTLSKLSGLMRAVDAMLSFLLGVVLLVAAMFIISLTVVVSAGKGI